MLKYEEMNLTDRVLAIVLTKIQEFCLKLAIINKNGNKKILRFIDKIYNKASNAHFKLFYGSDLATLLNKIKNVDEKQANFLVKKILMPVCVRSAKMHRKMAKMYLGEKTNQGMIEWLSFVLLGSILLRKTQAETFELLKEGVEKNVPRKTS
jgi:hypothetical protein